MPHRHAIQHLLMTARGGAMSGIDYVLIFLGAFFSALMLHFE